MRQQKTRIDKLIKRVCSITHNTGNAQFPLIVQKYPGEDFFRWKNEIYPLEVFDNIDPDGPLPLLVILDGLSPPSGG
jgi:hypothetical protein